jgi:hypothetical protein
MLSTVAATARLAGSIPRPLANRRALHNRDEHVAIATP